MFVTYYIPISGLCLSHITPLYLVCVCHILHPYIWFGFTTYYTTISGLGLSHTIPLYLVWVVTYYTPIPGLSLLYIRTALHVVLGLSSDVILPGCHGWAQWSIPHTWWPRVVVHRWASVSSTTTSNWRCDGTPEMSLLLPGLPEHKQQKQKKLNFMHDKFFLPFALKVMVIAGSPRHLFLVFVARQWMQRKW